MILGVLFSLSFVFASDHPYIYDLATKDIIRLSASEKTPVLMIDETCSVCEDLLRRIPRKKMKKLKIGLLKRPSFRWLAKKRLKFPKANFYQVGSLELPVKVFPTLFMVDSRGVSTSVYQGRSAIFKRLGHDL